VSFKAQALSGGTPLGGVLVSFYIDDVEVGSRLSDSSGYAVLAFAPSLGYHKWYVTGERATYTSASSPKRGFRYYAEDYVHGVLIGIKESIEATFVTSGTVAKILRAALAGETLYEMTFDLSGGVVIGFMLDISEVVEIVASSGTEREKLDRLELWMTRKAIDIAAFLAVSVLTGGPPVALLVLPLVDKIQEYIAPGITETVRNVMGWVWNHLMDFAQWLYKKVLKVIGGSTAVMMIIDPQGHRVGATYQGGRIVEVGTVPNSLYSGNSSHPQVIIIPNPSGGEYKIIVSSKINETVHLQVEITEGGLLRYDKQFSQVVIGGGEAEVDLTLAQLDQAGHMSVNTMPIVIWVKPVFPVNAIVGERVSFSVNASDPDGIGSVELKLLGPETHWYNLTVRYEGGLYVAELSTSGLPLGPYEVYLFIRDDNGYLWNKAYDLYVLGQLSLTGMFSKSEVVTGEIVTLSLTLKDQDEKPVGLASVRAFVGSVSYDASYSGDGRYSVTIDTRGLDGSYVVRANASKQGYASAQSDLSLVVRPWWWPYLPYMLATVPIAVFGAYMLTKKRRVIIGPPPPPPISKLLEETAKLVKQGDYREAAKHLANILRSDLIGILNLSESLTTDELVRKATDARKDLDSEKLRYVLQLGERCTFARYRPRKDEAEKTLRYSKELLEALRK